MTKSSQQKNKHSKSSKRWLQEHVDDEYVRRAQKEGFRSRSTYKLLEIQDKDKVIQPGMTVVDLGAAPGGWSQVASRLVTRRGAVIALDLLPMEPLSGVNFIQGDFSDDCVLDALCSELGGTKIDLVMSDMAPNMSGMRSVDQPRAMALCELAEQFAKDYLKLGGHFLVKLFQGEGSDVYIARLKKHYDTVLIRKPKSSRSRSREIYVLARNFK